MDGQVGFVLLEAGAIGFIGRPAWLGSGRHLAAWVFDRNDVNFYQKCCGPATNSKTQTVLRKLGLFHIVAGTGAEWYLAIVWWWLFRSLFVQGWRPWPPTHLASVMDGLWKASFGQETLQRFHEPHRTDGEEGRWHQKLSVDHWRPASQGHSDLDTCRSSSFAEKWDQLKLIKIL